MIKGVNHISFTIKSIDKSIKFYQEVLGLKIKDVSTRNSKFASKATGISGAKLKIAYLSAKNCSIELIQYTNIKGKKVNTKLSNPGSSHVCFNVSNIHRVYKKILQSGVKVVSKPLKIPAGPNKGKLMFYCQDPDYNHLEFISAN